MSKTLCVLGILALGFSVDGSCVEYTGDKFRDPFGAKQRTPEAHPEEELSRLSFVLQGIVWNAKMPQAVINNKVVRQGNQVEGAEIVEITKQGVKMRYKEKEFNLRLKGEQRQ